MTFPVVYHVTHTSLVPLIRRLGLRLLQTSNWVNGKGTRLGGGAIFAFEHYDDARRWAARMEWEHYRSTGAGKISILTLETGTAVDWDNDFTDTLSQMGCKGAWLKTFQTIPAVLIKAVESFTIIHYSPCRGTECQTGCRCRKRTLTTS